jgi:hypothetical protein
LKTNKTYIPEKPVEEVHEESCVRGDSVFFRLFSYKENISESSRNDIETFHNNPNVSYSECKWVCQDYTEGIEESLGYIEDFLAFKI